MLPERVSVEASEPKEFTPYLHFQHTLEGCSLLYELMKTRNPIEAPPIITPIDAFNTLSGLHSFGVYPVGGRQSQHARKSGPPTEEAKPPKNEKGVESLGTCLGVYKCRPTRFHLGHNWGSSGLQVLSFPSFSHPEPLRLQYINMSGASLFAGTHHFVASNNTFNEAKIVSGMFTKSIHQAS